MVSVSINWKPKKKSNHAFGAFSSTELAFIELLAFVNSHNLKDYTISFRSIEVPDYADD